MKNLMKKITLIAVAFLAFSCTQDKPETFGTTTIGKLAIGTPDMSSFVNAVDVAGLTSTYENTGSYTVFIPNNDAFSVMLNNLGEPSLEQLEVDYPGRLATILKYNMLDTKVKSSTLTDGQVLSSSQGQNFTVGINPETGSITLTDASTGVATVYVADVNCSNGYIYTTDNVLLPTF